MATIAGPPPPLGESGNSNSVSRITREGKKITYKMSIMQQPKRARACGQGSKSHTDRRPVDPPPVIELNIFESDPHDDSNKTDITFVYNANFFLFATLEPERPIATGKLMTNQGSPVLTGVPVAGVAYLDKPNRAGYFIFPDLSVRNEGTYRFSFHLFEQIKDPKDATEGTQPMPSPVPGKLSSPQQFLDFRLEVISNPFIVYSAKKFPGLTTSTPISRMIAEQGCRVRIRRDVRMRRRGDKRTENYDYDNERAYNSRRTDQYAGSDAYANAPERPRSTSISTAIDPYSYPSRRPSAVEYGHQISSLTNAQWLLLPLHLLHRFLLRSRCLVQLHCLLPLLHLLLLTLPLPLLPLLLLLRLLHYTPRRISRICHLVVRRLNIRLPSFPTSHNRQLSRQTRTLLALRSPTAETHPWVSMSPQWATHVRSHDFQPSARATCSHPKQHHCRLYAIHLNHLETLGQKHPPV
ncbi:velvet factor-domain-containing protein [Aspergillus recurvatus]